MFDIRAGAYTDAGDIRPTNQDSILNETGKVANHSVGLFIVADGCGGMAFGEEISGLAVTYFRRVWDTELKELLTRGKVSDGRIDQFLEDTIFLINKGAIDFGEQVGEKVGTTLSLLLVIDNKFYIKNIGDSRVYLIRKGKIERLTEDQSLVATMIRNKELTIEESKNFSKKNVLTMCVGHFNEVKTHTKTGKVKNGDMFLLCSDGLYNYIPESTFWEILKEADEKDPKVVAKLLRQGIPQGYAGDNVSVVLAKFKRRFFGRVDYCI